MEEFIFFFGIVNFFLLLTIVKHLSKISKNTEATARIIAAAHNDDIDEFLEQMEADDMKRVHNKLMESIQSLWK